MATCEKIEFYKGDDIEFYLTPTVDAEDLDNNDWQLLFYSIANTDIVRAKTDMVFVEANKYYGIIVSDITKDLVPDNFTCELLYGSDKKKIDLKDMTFILKDSHSKNYV